MDAYKSKNISKLRVLIVDDQSDVRSMLRTMLGELGITQVFEAAEGREAMNFLDAAVDFVDMIICDWNMPKMTGVEVLRQLRSVYADIPFLMLTARNDMDSVFEAKAAGVTAYIRKPFSPAQLEAKIRIVMHRMEKENAVALS